ncbi:hypothetical protein SAMN05444170_0040 [Bradyrhizobium erythrophlei]|uniref:Uncharacterized protein n=1 Tax=Bradyrhizobium erythrophlei TaxID=1437360 RepID=A0A1M7SQS4_9BRAD|nr:hypothetical protein SAMN05444170_0040 [Bradyrhizobium erythrophlei]
MLNWLSFPQPILARFRRTDRLSQSSVDGSEFHLEDLLAARGLIISAGKAFIRDAGLELTLKTELKMELC